MRLVFVHDPTDYGDAVIPIGKQTLRPSHIFYTPCSGIWQTVWLEAVPQAYITKLDLDADMDERISDLSSNGEDNISLDYFKEHFNAVHNKMSNTMYFV